MEKGTFLNGDQDLKVKAINYMNSRIADFERFLHNNEEDEEKREEIEEEFANYGLSFDFVEAGTFDNNEGYFRYQLSWGGPSDEIRFYPDGSIQYVYLDWFVGCGFDVTHDSIFQDLQQYFEGIVMLDFDSKSPEDLYLMDHEEEE